MTATAIRGAITLAKLSSSLCCEAAGGMRCANPTLAVTSCGPCAGAPHPAPGHCSSQPLCPRRSLVMARTDHCWTSARGCSVTLGNFSKATFDAISKTDNYLTLISRKIWCSSSLHIRNSLTILPRPLPGFPAEDPGSSYSHHMVLYEKNAANWSSLKIKLL